VSSNRQSLGEQLAEVRRGRFANIPGAVQMELIALK